MIYVLTLSVLSLGSIFDIRTRKVPNWIFLCGIFLAIPFLWGNFNVFESFGGLGVSAMVLIPLYTFKLMGAGDVKLGFFLGFVTGVEITFFTLLFSLALASGISFCLFNFSQYRKGLPFIPFMLAGVPIATAIAPVVNVMG